MGLGLWPLSRNPSNGLHHLHRAGQEGSNSAGKYVLLEHCVSNRSYFSEWRVVVIGIFLFLIMTSVIECRSEYKSAVSQQGKVV